MFSWWPVTLISCSCWNSCSHSCLASFISCFLSYIISNIACSPYSLSRSSCNPRPLHIADVTKGLEYIPGLQIILLIVTYLCPKISWPFPSWHFLSNLLSPQTLSFNWHPLNFFLLFMSPKSLPSVTSKQPPKNFPNSYSLSNQNNLSSLCLNIFWSSIFHNQIFWCFSNQKKNFLREILSPKFPGSKGTPPIKAAILFFLLTSSVWDPYPCYVFILFSVGL